MNILAIETSSALLSVACKRGDERVVESNLDGGFHHAEKIMTAVVSVLKKAKLKKSDLDFLTCGVGPGSFTGLRIGLAATKGIAAGLEKKVVPVSSLDLIAEGITLKEGKLLVILNARRERMYAALYEFKNGIPKKILKDSLVSIEDLVKCVEAGTYVAGDAIQVYSEGLKEKLKKIVFLEEKFWKPTASAALKWLSRQNKYKLVTAGELKPAYLRLTEAEERRGKKS